MMLDHAGWLNFNYVPGHFWCRFGGAHRAGILIKDTRRHELMFSQRWPDTPNVQVGRLYIELLKSAWYNETRFWIFDGNHNERKFGAQPARETR